jgi:hypothetical protein
VSSNCERVLSAHPRRVGFAMTPDPIVNLLGPLDGARIDGGCEECDAVQSVRSTAGVWVIDVRHEDGCPRLRVMRNAEEEGS